ncbi:MAG: TRC40/GET3/ArsA family transport-energizing ATPase [Planctomycetota bacterium]
MNLTESLTRLIFFTGKGGVGKTSLACATAVQLADGGRRVLLVSTDPASNLDEVLQTPLGTRPTAVPAVPGLQSVNLDPRQAAAEYRQRMVEPYRGVLPESVIANIEEQFSGACTMEIAAFEKFAALLADPAATSVFDSVVFDTAPTGHTLRLLALPAAWTNYLQQNTTGVSCAGPLAGLRDQQALFERAAGVLRDTSQCTFVLVARADRSSLREAARTCRELQHSGIQQLRLAINGVFRPYRAGDALADAVFAAAQRNLQVLPETLRTLPRTEIGYSAVSQPDPAWLRRLIEPPVDHGTARQGEAPGEPLKVLSGGAGFGDGGERGSAKAVCSLGFPPLDSLIDQLAVAGHGVILTMGKGGVGKTSVAATVARALAVRGNEVLLTTTDPAAEQPDTTQPGLTIARIDPELETQKYRQQVLNQCSAGLDAAGLALLEEDLRSPCTEEVAVFRAFAEVVAGGERQFVVVDTAPTGHTLLLLDAAQAFHREVERQGRALPESVQRLLPTLRDPAAAKILLVVLPEATPVHEAGELQEDLRRAGIEPFAWVVNQVFSGLSTADPSLQARQAAEQRWLLEIQKLATRATGIPWTSGEFQP